MSTTRWRTVSLSDLSADFASDVEPARGAGAQAFVVQRRTDGAVAALRTGADVTLPWWRAQFGDRPLAFGAESPAVLCGHPAVRQEVIVPAETSTGLVQSESGQLGHIEEHTPALVHIVLAGTTARGLPFVAEWTVPDASRASLRADEEHFFASVRCG